MPDKNTRALGRGLDKILGSPETDITSRDISGDFVAGAVAEIDINLIESPVRTHFWQVVTLRLGGTSCPVK